MRVLLVEDDLLFGDTINETLRGEGYSCDWLKDGAVVDTALASDSYDLLILDNWLPGKTGVEILKQLRERDLDIPVLMLTACDSVSDKVVGLDAGADDYLTKPFDMDELFARIRSLLRRRGKKNPLLSSQDLTMDVAERKVFYCEKPVKGLTAKELAILEVLLRNKGRFITKHRLLDSCTRWDADTTLNNIEVYISRLRKRFGPEFIETLRGVGYRVKD